MQIYINFYQLLYLLVHQVKSLGHLLSQNNGSGWPAPHDDKVTIIRVSSYMRLHEI